MTSPANPVTVSAPPRRLPIRVPRPQWILLAAIGLAVAGTGVRFGVPMYREGVAAREIERAGGKVGYMYGGPIWLLERLGSAPMRPFLHVHEVHLAASQNTDAVLEYVAGLPSLARLDLSASQVTDAGLKHVARMPNLKWLDLHYT